MKTKLHFITTPPCKPRAFFQILTRGRWLAALAGAALVLPAVAAGPQTANPSAIPLDQIAAAVDKQYPGDGFSVRATPDGARLRCVFQKMEGEVTRDGLWLMSTAKESKGEHFRIVATAVGRMADGVRPSQLRVNGAPSPLSDLSDGTTTKLASEVPCATSEGALSPVGSVEVAGNVARFIRAGLTEEYRVSVDGVQQDFVIAPRPGGQGQLRVDLDVAGARAESLANGARLVLDGSGRKIAYSRLRVTDATGHELPARIEILSEGDEVTSLESLRKKNSAQASSLASAPTSFETPAPALAVLVDDRKAVYPVRIDPTFSDANWVSMGGLFGTDGRVNAAVVDGSGNLYIGGEFTIVGDVVANNIAKWNGSSWSALGSGLFRIDVLASLESVRALAVSGSNLYAGGFFTSAGGRDATNIAKWDGSSWSAMGSGIMDQPVDALAVLGSDVYAGGGFTNAGGSAANYIAKWDGSGWSALGSGMDAAVGALAVSDSDLYAGGDFTTAGGSAATNIAKWNGSNWSALGSGMGGGRFGGHYVNALAVSGRNLYAGGEFTTAGGTAAGRIAKWDGSSWSALGSGSGMPDQVLALAVSGTNLYAGGFFSGYIAKWDGSSWSALDSGVSYSVRALAVSGTNLYAGGEFTSPANRIAKWDGSSWSALGYSGMDDWVNVLKVSGSNLYAGGVFTRAGGTAANYIAKWNGSNWSALGSGMGVGFGLLHSSFTYVNALAVSGTNLYAGGDFTTAGGSAATNIAKWNGSSWSALGAGIGGRALALGGTAFPEVYALEASGPNLYAGGDFSKAGGKPANCIAKWNGSSWSALGLGMNGPVHALAVSGSDLYAGGAFTNAGGSPANYIAKWNGSSWSALGSGMDAVVYALAVSGTNLYAGGAFTNAGGSPANYIARWNGSSWSALASGMNGTVLALAVSGNDLYVGGWSTIAKWNGSSWSALGSGMNSTVLALAVSGNDLYAGGDFTMAGGKISAYVARALLTPTLQFDAASYSTSESNGLAQFTVIRVGDSQGEVQVTAAITGGTATPGVDYGPLSVADPLAVTLTFGDGQTNIPVSFVITNDSIFDPDETILLTLRDPTGGSIMGSQSNAVIRIIDDDPRPDTNAPKVTITAPAAGLRLTNSTVKVQGTAQDNFAVTLVEFRLENARGTNAYAPAMSTNRWTNWVATVTLNDGTNVVRVRARDDSGNYSLKDATRVFTYVPVDRLTLTTNGNGHIAPNLNGRFLPIGQLQTITAVPGPGFVFSNWSGGLSSTSARLSLHMESNLMLQANFVRNPFIPVKGSYNGLFYDTTNGVRHESSGFFTFTITDHGAYSGHLQGAGRTLPFTGQFDLEGHATTVVKRTGTNSLEFELSLVLTGNSSSDVTGLLINTNSGWVADLMGDRAPVYTADNPSPYQGRYTLAIPWNADEAGSPGGDGFGTVTVAANGHLTFAGTLADGTPAVQSVLVSKDGFWPWYVPLYGGKGSILSWATLNTNPPPDNSLNGTLSWIKPVLATTKHYSNGFTFHTSLEGSVYHPPGTNAVLQFPLGGSGEIDFRDGNLIGTFTNLVALDPNNRVRNLVPLQPLTMTITAGSRLFNGSVTLTNAGRRTALSFKGAILQRQNHGTGFFFGESQSGRVYFGPAP